MTTANSRAAKRPPSKDTVVMRPMPCREELGVGVSVVIGLPKSDMGIGNYLREEVTFNSQDAWFMGIRARAYDWSSCRSRLRIAFHSSPVKDVF
jgi:hypothetical protein